MATNVKPKPRRDYKLADGTPVKGATTIINNLGWKTPGLVWWAFRQAREHPEIKSPYEPVEAAADIGTVVHRAVELLLHGLPDTEAEKHLEQNLPAELLPQAENGLLGFYQWRDGFQFEVTDTEVPLVSELYRYGGTLDTVGLVNGERALVDLKTAADIYPDTWVQLSAYSQLWDENHPADLVKHRYALRVDKENGGFDFSYRPSLPEAWAVFEALLVIEANRKKVK